ncbi:hypothetical protein ELG83_33275 (plasmid) [Rhizobium leguminosarum]|uniref:Uncharacterized protein n=1 Tax=Rhizobium leguminosarum bv. viciae TaxID=387 RepID=A0A8G2J297_RHILV|nr:hypothetical protein [Rhizobium leguminosarum bv. viciae]TBF69433.1 hypothetical protein ELG86_31470 [Rhizobium leguminosarum]NKK22047.1 hypothetical protein [Rhizobium leguminosarum bv. viciae]TBF87039.1 hypothetical protein ELG83_33275 [Rhizobium leguminosarum]TBG01179.1 hypothetical protein ELG85_21635 [Rhizobium leguminosarum]
MTMTARQQLKRRDWPAAFFRSLGHASWAAEQTEAGACAEGPRPPFLIAFRRDIPLFKSVSKLGHDQSVARRVCCRSARNSRRERSKDSLRRVLNLFKDLDQPQHHVLVQAAMTRPDVHGPFRPTKRET